jgi:20S proteasome subunit beta 6
MTRDVVLSRAAGHGWSYGYDALGSQEKVRTVCSGTGQTLLQPVLDNQVEHRQMSEDAIKEELSLTPCVELVKDAFASAGERDIYTGDTVEIFKITAKGVEVEKFELRRD